MRARRGAAGRMTNPAPLCWPQLAPSSAGKQNVSGSAPVRRAAPGAGLATDAARAVDGVRPPQPASGSKLAGVMPRLARRSPPPLVPTSRHALALHPPRPGLAPQPGSCALEALRRACGQWNVRAGAGGRQRSWHGVARSVHGLAAANRRAPAAAPPRCSSQPVQGPPAAPLGLNECEEQCSTGRGVDSRARRQLLINLLDRAGSFPRRVWRLWRTSASPWQHPEVGDGGAWGSGEQAYS